MFICGKCLEKNYTNSESICKSFGRCEDCGKTATCNDIPSYMLDVKRKPKKKK
jgi:hypothetical protein